METGKWMNFDKNNILFPDGTRLLIKVNDDWKAAIYNEHCECFDDEEGDDWLCDLDSVQEFFLVP